MCAGAFASCAYRINVLICDCTDDDDDKDEGVEVETLLFHVALQLSRPFALISVNTLAIYDREIQRHDMCSGDL